MRQHTIRKAVSIEGVGLHSGKVARVTISPAPADAGVVFKVRRHGRADPRAARERRQLALRDDPRRERHAHPDRRAPDGGGGRARDRQRRDRGGRARDPRARRQREALRGVARVRGPCTAVGAPPDADRFRARFGSGAAGDGFTSFPSDALRITYTLDNDHPAIGTQVLSWSPTERSFVEEFAPARTYGFLRDLGLMRKNGLARGGSLDNAIVLGNSGAAERPSLS